MHASLAFRPSAAPPPAAQWVTMGAVAVILGVLLSRAPAVLTEWVMPGALALLWLGMAAGIGRVVRRMLFPRLSLEDPRRGPLALALGVAVALALDNALGSWGALARPGSFLAAWMLVLGNALAVGGIAPLLSAFRLGQSWRAPLLWCALGALGALTAAAATHPGLLWSTEFGGYDALSYHLQLPKEWLAGGAIVPLQHNVYSAFPSFLEGAYLHLFALGGGAWPAHGCALAAQMLHALLAVSAAWVVAVLCATGAHGVKGDHIADDHERRWARAVGWCMMLGVPWVLVTGSLAYNDLGVVLLLAGAMLAWTACDATGGFRLGAAVGLLLGGAAGCKLTALGMAALPFAAWALFWPRGPGLGRALFAALPVAIAFAALLLWPWMSRNADATGATFFPFVVQGFSPDSGVGRNGWWSAEQIARFAAAHGAEPGAGWGDRLAAFWDCALREGIGTAPTTGAAAAAPWLPQWSIAFWIGLSALALLLRRMPRQSIALAAMLAAQIGFWMLATHMQPRFLLPCLVVLAPAAAWALAPLVAARRRGVVHLVGAALLAAWCLQPVAMLWLDARTRHNLALWAGAGPDAALMGPGSEAMAHGAIRIGDPIPLAWAANYLLPKDALLACEGEADVFWCRTTPLYGTVWDGGPLADALRAHGGNADAVVRALRGRGITHLVISEPMLARWRDAGWLDPALTPERVRAVAARLRPIARLSSGGMLYVLP